ncbi:MAG TPA: TolC family protein [Vicinamibacteria bacterium]|nr:TolC family protein [Vicinamibacteria bacterium]
MRRPLALLLVAATSTPAAAEPLTLSQALRQAGRTSEPADAARLVLAQAREDSAQIKALYLPELTLAAGYRAQDPRPELRTPPIEVGPLQIGPITTAPITLPSQVMPIEDRDSWRYRVAAQYLVWDFGRRGSALSASRARENAVGHAGSGEVRRRQAEVAARYLSLLNLKAQKRVVAQRRETLQAHLATVRALFENGVVARNDLLRTEVALRGVDDAERALDAAYASSLEALNVAMGLPATTPQELPEELGAPPTLPWDEAACRRRAVEQSDAVRAQRAKVEALDGEIAYRRRDRLPNVLAEASHTYAQNSNLVHEHDTALAVGVSWSVFDGGARSARVRLASAAAERGRRELLEAERSAESAAAAALRALGQCLREEETARQDVAAAAENLRIVSDQYKEGLLHTTDVLEAESVLAASRSALAERRYRAYTDQAALLAALGEDLPAFYDAIPPKR